MYLFFANMKNILGLKGYLRKLLTVVEIFGKLEWNSVLFEIECKEFASLWNEIQPTSCRRTTLLPSHSSSVARDDKV